MNLNKRFFLINVLTMAFFAAMDLAPLHKQSFPTVLANLVSIIMANVSQVTA